MREAVWTILVADAAMSVENVLGVGGAAHGDLPLLAFGLIVSIPIVLFGSGIIAGVLDRAPSLIWVGALALIWTSADMILGDPALDPHVVDHWIISAGAALAILGAIVGIRALRHPRDVASSQ
jgi:predicted tellurium resistance membrane protein TerC